MRLGTRIKEARNRRGLTQVELADKTGLTERTVQRIENHEVEPSKFSLIKIGEALNENFNEQKQKMMKKRERVLKIVIWSISVLIILEFAFGILTWTNHWWVLLAWFIPVLSGISIPYYRKTKRKSV